MKAFTVALVVALLYIQNACSRPRAESDFIEEALKIVPAEEQVDFLKFHVKLGYDLLQKLGAWPDNLTSGFAVQLYEYAKNFHEITKPSKDARVVICFDDGTCIDIGDIGVHPN